MADATFLPNYSLAQFSRPGAESPRLAAPISATDTTVLLTAIPYDHNNAAITGNCLLGIQGIGAYVETIWCPAGSISGSTITGCVRGIRLDGLDNTTGDPTLAVKHDADSPVVFNISGVMWSQMVAAFQGAIASGGTAWKIGRGINETISVTAQNANANKPTWRWNSTSGKWEYSDDGISFSYFGTGSGLSGGAGITIGGGVASLNTADTTKFVLSSSGAPDSGKVPLLNSLGQLADGFNSAINLITSSVTLGESVSAGDVVGYRGGAVLSDVGSIGSSGGVLPATYTTNWNGQTFTVDSGCSKVIGARLQIGKVGTGGTGPVVVSVYATSAGLPTGAPLVSTSIPVASITASGWTNVAYVQFTPTAVTPGGVYALVISNTGGDNTTNYVGAYHNSGLGYAGGNVVSSTNSGSTWTATAANDYYGWALICAQSNDGKVYKMKANDMTRGNMMVGIMAESGVLNDTKKVYTSGSLGTFTSASKYFVSDAGGAPTTTQGSQPYQVGVAPNTSMLSIRPRQVYMSVQSVKTGTGLCVNGANGIFLPTPFKPDRIFVKATSVGSGTHCFGDFVAWQNGTISQARTVFSDSAAAGTTGAAGTNDGVIYMNYSSSSGTSITAASFTENGVWLTTSQYMGTNPAALIISYEAYLD